MPIESSPAIHPARIGRIQARPAACAVWLVLLMGLARGQPLPESTRGTRHPTVPRYGAWTSCQIGGGGYLLGVVPCPSDASRFYAFSDVGGIYRSDDGAKTWRMLHGTLPPGTTHHNVRDVSVDPRNEDHLVAALGDLWTKAGLFVSRDGGLMWTKALAASFTGNGEFRAAGPLMARNPEHPDILLSMTEGTGLWRSPDNGITWSEIPGLRGIMPTDLKFNPRNPRQLWLCTARFDGTIQGAELRSAGGFFRSEDGGDTWKQLAASGPTETLCDPGEPGALYGLNGYEGVLKSSDSGATWTPWNEGLPVHPEKKDERVGWLTHNFTCLAAGPDFILITTGKGKIFRLGSGEKCWSPVEAASHSSIAYGRPWHAASRDPNGQEGRGSATSSVTVDPRNPDLWFLTDWFAISRSENAGKNWALAVDGIENTYIHNFLQDASHPDLLHLCMEDNGSFWSRDGGRFFHPASGISKDVKRMTYSAADPQRMYAVGVDQSGAGAKSNQVYLSEDRGVTWNPSPMIGLEAIRTLHGCTILADPKDFNLVYVTVAGKVKPGHGGVYASPDGGRTWQWMGNGLEDDFFHEDIWHIGRELAIDSTGGICAISHHLRLLYKWNVADEKWDRCGPAFSGHPNDLCVDPAIPGRLYLAVEDTGVFISDDAGASWSMTLGRPVRHLAVDLFHPERVAAGTSDGVAFSSDRGKNWTILDNSLPSRDKNCVGFVGNHIIAGSNGSGAFWMELPAPPADQP